MSAKSSRLEQRSAINFLTVKKYKSCAIYKKKCGICLEKYVLVKFFFTNRPMMTLLQQT